MSKIIYSSLAILVLGLFVARADAQTMMNRFSNSAADWDKVVEHTVRGEKEGKEIWTNLQAKEIECAKLSDEDFDALGEYFMGQMMGNSHAAMNAMMIQMHGEDGEGQIHIVMGKRLSGCDTAAAFSAGGVGWMPMMQMMGGGWGNMMGNWNNPLGYNPLGFYGLLTALTWIGLLVLLFLAIVKLWRSIKDDKTKK